MENSYYYNNLIAFLVLIMRLRNDHYITFSFIFTHHRASIIRNASNYETLKRITFAITPKFRDPPTPPNPSTLPPPISLYYLLSVFYNIIYHYNGDHISYYYNGHEMYPLLPYQLLLIWLWNGG